MNHANPSINDHQVFTIDNYDVVQHLNIIAAGPVHRIDYGVLGEVFQRIVLRVNYEGSRYRVDAQYLNRDGSHQSIDGVAGQLFEVYKDAFKAFLEAQINMHNFGYAYYDSDSDRQKLMLEVVSTKR